MAASHRSRVPSPPVAPTTMEGSARHASAHTRALARAKAFPAALASAFPAARTLAWSVALTGALTVAFSGCASGEAIAPGVDRGEDAGGRGPGRIDTGTGRDSGSGVDATDTSPGGDVPESDPDTHTPTDASPTDVSPDGTTAPDADGDVLPDSTGPTDTGPTDTGLTDTETPDTTTPDSGTPDTSVPDTSVPDTGPVGPRTCTPSTAVAACGAGVPCVDGYCCDSLCADVCAACDVPGREGTCSFRPPGFLCREANGPCDVAEVCDGTKSTCPDDASAANGTICGEANVELRCEGAACGARPQRRETPRICASGVCGTGSAGAWTDIASCDAASICVATASNATCQACNAPGPGTCEGLIARNPSGPGRCDAGMCAYDTTDEACTSTCQVSAGQATCASCNVALMNIPNAPLWSWDTGAEGWSLSGDWGRRTGSSARTGNGFLDTNASTSEYRNGRRDRNQWNASFDLSACTTCPLQVSFWVRGSTERNFDYLELQCSGNNGGSWTQVGARVTGGYSGWTRIEQTLPTSCLTTQTRLALYFYTDSSWTDWGYLVDDLRMHTTATAPIGYLDSASATSAHGWACDGDAWSDELRVVLRFYRNGTGTPAERSVQASDVRADLVTANVCGGTGNHGWTFTYDEALLTWLGSGTHRVEAFAVDGPAPCGAGEYRLTAAPRTFTR